MNANPSIQRFVPWSVVLIGLLVSGGAESNWHLTTRASADEPSRHRTTAVAVIPLTNASDDQRLTPIAEAIADMLIVQLSRVDSLVLVERTEIERVLREQALTKLTKDDQPLRLGKAVGAQFVLSGSVLEVDGELLITEHLIDIASTRVMKSHTVRTRPDRLDRAVARLSGDLTRDLDLELPELTDEQIDKTPEANLLFMRGLGLHFARMPDQAIVCFLMTLAIDPQHARARFWCGIAYAEAGETEHARIELTRFLKQFPQHPLTPRAKQWLAESDRKGKRPQKTDQ